MKSLKYLKLTIENSKSILGFSKKGGGDWKEWDRFLTIQGKDAYHIGNICGTCTFFFERLEGANQKISPEEISDDLKHGATENFSDLVEKIKPIIPNGEFYVSKQVAKPSLIELGSNEDYFSNEQLSLWGIDGFWNLPHNPKIQYYVNRKRTFEKIGFYEFIVPMFPQNWLDQKQVDFYKSHLEKSGKSTAIAISILDVKQPADWNGDPAITEHWCLTHYLIDGHHKMHASEITKKPISMISFLNTKESLCSDEDINRLFEEMLLE